MDEDAMLVWDTRKMDNPICARSDVGEITISRLTGLI